MKKCKLVLMVFLTIAALTTYFVRKSFAGGTQVEAQGTRPFSMGGAFIAVADSPEAVYYNPAGITQIEGFSVEQGLLSVNPTGTYKHASQEVVNSSDQSAMGPYAFMSWKNSSPVCVGLGIYAPFARETDFESTGSSGFGTAYALALRKDYSPVVAYEVNDQLSVGGGIIISQGKIKQEIQTAFGSGVQITDELDGYGFGGLLGMLYKLNEQFNIGVVYRSPINIYARGQREMSIWGAPVNSKANVHYPAQAGIGIAYMPTDKVTLALQADWTDWSYLNQVVTKLDGMADSVTTINSKDTVDLRMGLEFKPDDTTALRAGFLYLPAATPSKWILPQKPDYKHYYAATLGASKIIKDIEFGFLYEYGWSNKWNVTDNAYGYNGEYEVTMQTFGLSAKFTF